MTDYSHTSLKNSVATLLTEIAAQTKNDPDLEKLEKLARIVSIHLKAIDELQVHEKREADRRRRKRYTRFEELLPPPPAEYERMVALLNRHFGVAETPQAEHPYDSK